MDSYSDHPNGFEPAPDEAPPQPDVVAVIGVDERRMHVRAYNYWCSLLDGRDYPSIENLDPGSVDDFGPNSVLLDFSGSSDNPLTAFIGTAIREECGLGEDVKTIADVPGRSLLSRLTDHYLQIIANRAPVGFEAEFVNQRGHNICYRGILMPFSSDGDTIDFIYGVINWKDAGEAAAIDQIVRPTASPAPHEPDDDDALELTADMTSEADSSRLSEAERSETDAPSEFMPSHAPGPADLPSEFMPSHAPGPAEADPIAEEREAAEEEPLELEPAPAEMADEQPETPPYLAWEDGPLADNDDLEASDPAPAAAATEAEESDESTVVLGKDSGLADYLCAARESAEVCKQADGRSRVALYRALAMAYDFAIAAKRVPVDYLEILDDAGVKAQARAPMTPIVKLVFGVDYDKTRLTEFAAALSYADRMNVDFGEFQQFVEDAEGGLKGLVAAERKARRPDRPVVDKAAVARDRLRHAAPLALADLPTNQEFALVLTRRNAEGVHEIVQLVVGDGLLERALTKSAR